MLFFVKNPGKTYNNFYCNLFKFALFFIFFCFIIRSDAFAKEKGFYFPESFSVLAENSGQSVVNIRTESTSKTSGRIFRQFSKRPRGQFNGNDPFNDFFEKFFGSEQQQEYKKKSLGTGFIIDEKGYIVTNNHVVEKADSIKVKLKDGKEFEAEVVGRDSKTDLALIKIEAGFTLPCLKLGDSDKLKVGEWVVAIGSPFGLEQTVTAGIVSAKGRVIGSGPYDDFIQTDASINPGNSGGPLLNMRGEVIGINTAIIAAGSGIGFAIPAGLAKGIIEQLKAKGKVTRGWIGVMIQDLTPELSNYYGIKGAAEGALVTEVIDGEPAYKAGIKTNDVIIKVAGQKVKTVRDLTRMIADTGVGQIVRITVLRKGSKKNIKIKIAKREDNKVYFESNNNFLEDELGIEVADITNSLARRFNLVEKKGIIITGLNSSGKGSQAGLRKGDIIKELNHKRINSVVQFKKLIGKTKKGGVINLFVKRRSFGFIIITITK